MYCMQEEIINVGNAEVITERGLTPSKLFMIKYECIFDFFSEEPISITAKKKRESKRKNFSEMFRIRKWKIDECVSWSLYSEEREKLDSVILRKVIWYKKSDKDKYMVAVKQKQDYDQYLNSFPSIKCINIFLSGSQIKELRKNIKKIDKMITKGIKINQKLKNKIWDDTEILRLYDWGQIHLTWGYYKITKELDEEVEKLLILFDEIIKNNYKTIHSMSMNYSIPLKVYKKIYIMGEYDL